MKGVITQVDQAKDLGIIMDDVCNIKPQRLEAVAKISCVVSFQGQRWGLHPMEISYPTSPGLLLSTLFASYGDRRDPTSTSFPCGI